MSGLANLPTVYKQPPVMPSSVVDYQKIIPRSALLRLHNALALLPQAEFPVKHHFAPGNYGREILLRKDTVVMGKIHKHAHINVLASGKVTVATEYGRETFSAPCVWVNKPGVKRAVYAHEDSVWVCVHPTDSDNVDLIEDQVIAKTYDQLDQLLLQDDTHRQLDLELQ